jgi:HEAT repeat protein/ATP/ADP translocase
MTGSIRSWFAPFRSVNVRLTLLMGQSLSFGITLALLIITASALFLPEFGSAGLPYVYIVLAILGPVVFYSFAELQKRWSLPRLSIIVFASTAVILFLAWLGLRSTGSRWVSFMLLVLFTLFLQMGFIILGGQAGRLFDVRELKRLFPRVVAGFVAGFLIGGFITPPLATILRGTINVLLATVAGTLIILGFFVATDRRFHEVLVQSGPAQSQAPQKSLWKLISQRFVMLIVLYQMLAIIGSQILDFMVFAQAAVRFPDSASLTEFLGNYTVAISASDLVFLLLFAGLLLSRYGLNLGLLANPIVDGILLVVVIVAGIVLGVSSAIFFGLLVITRIIDITLTDGMRRGAINTSYQALPASDRVSVQTSVEGIAAPVALGIAGVVLIIFNAISALSILHIALFTLLVTIFWVAFGVLTYRDYAEALRHTLRRRALGEAALTLDDSSSLEVVEVMARSDSLREVRLALDLLESAEHPSLGIHLIALVDNPDPQIQNEALTRIENLRFDPALSAVQRCLEKYTDPNTKGAAIRALCALEEAEANELVIPYLDDSRREVAIGAAVGLLLYGGIPGVLAAGQRMQTLEGSSDPADRLIIARVIGEVGSRNFYQPLLELLSDADPTVRNTALQAAERVSHPRLIPLIIDNLDRTGSRSAAMSALVASGAEIIPYVEQALSGETEVDQEIIIKLVRACGQLHDSEATELLVRHIEYAEPEIRYRILLALNASGYRASDIESSAMVSRLRDEAEQAARIETTREELGHLEALERLQSALDDEYSRINQRVFLLLSFVHDARTMLRAEEQLGSSDSSQSALALEALDVTLPAEQKSLVLPLVDPQMDRSQRAERLSKMFPLPQMGRNERLRDVIVDADGHWSNTWTRACAIYAVARLDQQMYSYELTHWIEASLVSNDGILRETAAWALHKLAPDRFQDHANQLANDPDPHVARLAAELSV